VVRKERSTTVPTRQQIELEFDQQQRVGQSALEKLVNAKWSEVAQKPWKSLGKDALKFLLTKGAGQVPVVGGGIAWVLDQALTEDPPGKPIGNALAQLAVLREFHAGLRKMLAGGPGAASNWQIQVRHLAIMALAVQEANKQLAQARRSIERIENILSANYHESAFRNLLDKIVEEATPAIELTEFPRLASLKPLARGS
jgi:hypothetical protein